VLFVVVCCCYCLLFGSDYTVRPEPACQHAHAQIITAIKHCPAARTRCTVTVDGNDTHQPSHLKKHAVQTQSDAVFHVSWLWLVHVSSVAVLCLQLPPIHDPEPKQVSYAAFHMVK